jgi:hypothetical protein
VLDGDSPLRRERRHESAIIPRAGCGEDTIGLPREGRQAPLCAPIVHHHAVLQFGHDPIPFREGAFENLLPVELIEPADVSDRDDVGTHFCEPNRMRPALATRGPGDQGDHTLELTYHDFSLLVGLL